MTRRSPGRCVRRLLDEPSRWPPGAIACRRPPNWTGNRARKRSTGLSFRRGQGAAAMRRTVEDTWPSPGRGLPSALRAMGAQCRSVRVVEGLIRPEFGRVEAAEEILENGRTPPDGDLLLVLLSGGRPPCRCGAGPGHCRQAGRDRALLGAGADIQRSMRCATSVRRSRACGSPPPRRRPGWHLPISNVGRDDPATFGSGPTAAHPTTWPTPAAFCAVSDRAAARRGERAGRTRRTETTEADDPRLGATQYRLIATPRSSLPLPPAEAKSPKELAGSRYGRRLPAKRAIWARPCRAGAGERAAHAGRPTGAAAFRGETT